MVLVRVAGHHIIQGRNGFAAQTILNRLGMHGFTSIHQHSVSVAFYQNTVALIAINKSDCHGRLRPIGHRCTAYRQPQKQQSAAYYTAKIFHFVVLLFFVLNFILTYFICYCNCYSRRTANISTKTQNRRRGFSRKIDYTAAKKRSGHTERFS